MTRKLAFRRGGPLARVLAMTRRAVVVVGGWVFVHGGLSATALQYTPAALNAALYTYLTDQSWRPTPAFTEGVAGRKGVLWTRPFTRQAKPQPGNDCTDATRFIRAWGRFGHDGKLEGAVYAHTTQDSIRGVCKKDGRPRVYLADYAASGAFGTADNPTPNGWWRRHDDKVAILEFKQGVPGVREKTQSSLHAAAGEGQWDLPQPKRPKSAMKTGWPALRTKF